jgi:O-antigen/teichoic acid export membrane protein
MLKKAHLEGSRISNKGISGKKIQPIYLVPLSLSEKHAQIIETRGDKALVIGEFLKTSIEQTRQTELQSFHRSSLNPISPEDLSIDKQATLIIPVAEALGNAQKLQTHYLNAEGYTSHIRTLAKSSSIYALASVAAPLVSLILAPFLTHRLSHTEYGVLAVLTAGIALMAGMTQLGLKNAFFRAYNCDYESQHDRLGILSTVVILLSLSSITLLITVMTIAPWLSTLLFSSNTYSQPLKIAAVVILIQNLTVPGFAWLRAENHAISYTALSIANLLVNLVGAIVLVGMFNMGIAGALLAIAGGYAVVMLFTLPIIILRAGLCFRIDITQNLLSFGVPLVSSFVSYWVLQLSDRFLLSRLGSLSQTASYAVAYSLGGVLGTIILTPFSLAWPTAMFTIAKKEDAAHVFRLVFRWYSIVLLFSAFALSILSLFIFNTFFPISYRSATPVIPIIALSITFYGIYDMFLIGIGIRRKTWFAFIFMTIAALINVGLNFILIPHYGSIGAAISTLLAYILLDLMAYVVNQKIYPIPFGVRTFLVATLSGIVLYAGGSVLAQTQGMLGAFIIHLCALSLYSGCLLVLGMLSGRSDRGRYRYNLKDTLV